MSHLQGAKASQRPLSGIPGFVVEWRAMRPITVRIDSAALRHNLGAARRRAPRSRICAVVKANAYGHGLARAARALAAAEGLALIELEAALELMTQFADADGKRGVRWQLERFDAATAGVDLPKSVANSAALLRYPEAHKDWVRPGIMLYGCSPFPDESAAALGLKPAMTLASELVAVRDLRAGDGVGYGGTYAASGAMRIGVVACGYADGYPPHAPAGTPILVAGKRTRTVGRVAMDTLFADLTGIPEAAVGSPATLWGEGLPADEVAASAGTVSYELLCALSQRVPVSEAP